MFMPNESAEIDAALAKQDASGWAGCCSHQLGRSDAKLLSKRSRETHTTRLAGPDSF